MNAIRLLSGLLGNKSLSSGLGGQLLGGLLGGGGGGGGMGSILGSVLGGGGGQSGGGLGGMLGGVLGGGGDAAQDQQQAQGGGGLGGMLGSVLGGGDAAPAQAGAGGLGGLLGSVLGGGAAAEIPQEQQAAANDQATVLIRAMVNAAKSDGRVDQTEQDNIVSKLGEDVSPEEVEFLRKEFSAPLDVQGFASSVPQGLEQQVYFLSLTSIELDTEKEAQYLGQLAQAMKLDPQVCNQIHDQIKAPRIFQ